ncbi:hypothetical protein SAY87_019830 [Trapa incisa]|uniref:SCP domain-containing protein n=1 Tax=Trapa incisa TaxID=236973 RepID=A0AAN7K2W7_9MYRT|nr:hypothetical protein SAY87_019830 [Trapa incisa]
MGGYLIILCTVLFLATSSELGKGKEKSYQDFVDTHNSIRAEVGVGPIAWNHTLAAYTQKYANERIQDCDMEHPSGTPYGRKRSSSGGRRSQTTTMSRTTTTRRATTWASFPTDDL